MEEPTTQIKEDHAELIAEVIERGEELGITVELDTCIVTGGLESSNLSLYLGDRLDPFYVAKFTSKGECSAFLSLEDAIKVLGLLEKGPKETK